MENIKIKLILEENMLNYKVNNEPSFFSPIQNNLLKKTRKLTKNFNFNFIKSFLKSFLLYSGVD